MLGFATFLMVMQCVMGAPTQNQTFGSITSANKMDAILRRPKREFLSEGMHIIEDCIGVTSKEGQFYFKSVHPASDICGLYFITDPEMKIEITLEYVDISCRSGGILSVVDGWELSGEYFPSPDDHQLSLDDRIVSTCNEKVGSHFSGRSRFVSSQNAALVQFQVPKKGESFAFKVRYIPNLTPCNILVEGTSDVYTLTNHGKRWNCSVTTLFPAEVQIQSINVGTIQAKRIQGYEAETGTLHKCEKRRLPDYIQIGGSSGLDTSKLAVADTICGYENRMRAPQVMIGCGISTVRLVSSGRFFNTAIVEIRPADLENLPLASVVCE